MEAKEYQNLAMRTNDGKGTERLEKWIGEETGAEYKGDVMIENEIDAGGLLNGCLGLSGEAGECELYRPSLLSCGYDVIEAVQTDAYDEGGEYAENYLDDVTKEQREELEEQLDVVFNAWLEKHDLYPNFYTIPAYETYKYIDGKFEREEE